MYEALNLKYDVLTKHNYKGLTVENFHRFLIKSVTIAAEERGTNHIFVPTSVEEGYAWNNELIDDTNMFRSTSAIGREFHFPSTSASILCKY